MHEVRWGIIGCGGIANTFASSLSALDSGILLAGASRTGDKAAFLAFVTEDLVKSRGLRADALVREVAKVAGGGGGGKPTLATAGGKQPEKVSDAIREARQIFERQLSDTGSS